MEAIVYTSNTGHAKGFAHLLSKEIGIPCYSLEDAKVNLNRGVDIIYIGWIMAGQVKNLSKAIKLFNVKMVCAVGMGINDNQLSFIREKYAFQTDFPLFYLQGGFEYDKLHGLYKLFISVIKKSMEKQIEKREFTDEGNELLDLVLNGRSFVCKEKLTSVIEYIKEGAI